MDSSILRYISRTSSDIDSKVWFNRLRIFSSFRKEDKERLLLTTLSNDTRVATDSVEIRTLLMKQMFCSPSIQFRKMLALATSIELNSDNFINELMKSCRLFQTIPGTKDLERCFALNLLLYKAGLCPIMMFSFDTWKSVFVENDLIDLIELSTSFLYRLIDCPSFSDPDFGSPIGKGGYSEVFLSRDGHNVYKVPKNLAQLSFGGDEEFAISTLLGSSSIAVYIPKMLKYDAFNKILTREFIADGVSGFDLIKTAKDFWEKPIRIDQIKEIYDYACMQWERMGINLDIHPGNFLWSPSRKQWFFVDLGPMPKIGAEYFPRNDFKSYFQKIWIDLPRLMIDVPIRSVDISCDFVDLTSLMSEMVLFLEGVI
ncbi:MAG: hypothetical protein LBF57_03945 [Holosporaceae bacterium]|nr:hypothetical protein [Holosporaceae bacterium]